MNSEYMDFIIKNRIKVNKYLNVVMWFFVITGPAIAIGVHAGIYKNITYGACAAISVTMILLSAAHLIMLKKIPTSAATGIFALTALDFLLVYMAYSHVAIRLTWFLVPMLSILFCSRGIFFYSVAINYILMFGATWITATYENASSTQFGNVVDFFTNVIGGYTIETVIMTASGYMIGKLIVGFFMSQFEQYEQLEKVEKEMEKRMDILDSMAEIYDNVNLISFVNRTEMNLREDELIEKDIDMVNKKQTRMAKKLTESIVADQRDEFRAYTDITTVRSRLAGKKLISSDFIDVVKGWFRAQYIPVDSTIDGIPNVVIFTTRSIDDEKRREEHLIRISMTDELTRLYNRRCYEEDLAEHRKKELEPEFVLFSIDVNGLKTVNDTMGHAAGDELIKGAADCLSLAVGHNGKAYRTGGDEFMAILHSDNPEAMRERMIEKATEWRGVYVKELSMSIGFAAAGRYPGKPIDDLEHLADADMYEQKEKYYETHGITRRK